MKVLNECTGGFKIALLTDCDEIGRLVTKLEEIGSGEGWEPGTSISDYAASACHLAVIKDLDIVGGAQVMLGSRCCVFSFAGIWPETTLADAGALAHVSVLALDRSIRGYGSPFYPLCAELWRLCQSARVQEIWHEVTPTTLRLYRRMGWPLKIVGDLRTHWGEPCYLTRMGMSEVAESLVEKAKRSPANALLVAQARRSEIPPFLLTAA